MNIAFRLLVCAGALAVLGACGGNDAAPAPASSAGTDAAAASPVAPVATPDSQASGSVSMAQVDHVLAGYEALTKAGEQDPSMEELATMNASTEKDADHAARIAANPKAVALLAQAGTTPAEYARMLQRLSAGIFAYGMLESGTAKEVPEGADVPMLDFMKAHGTEVARKMKASGLL